MLDVKKIVLLSCFLAVSVSSIAAEYKHKAPVHGLLPPGNPYFSITPFNIQFPSTPVGSSSTAAVTVTNPDTFESLVNVRAALDSNVFSFESNTCGTSAAPSIIQASQSCSAVIKFTPVSVGSFTGTFAISADNSRNGTQSRLFTAEATGSPSLVESSNTSTTASVIQGNSHAYPFTFYNSGNVSLSNIYAAVSGDAFAISSNSCGSEAAPVSLSATQSCSVTVLGSSLDVGSYSGVLSMISGSNSVLTKNLQLQSVAPVSSLNVSPSSFNFGNVTTGTYISRTVSISNMGNVSANNIFVSVPSITGLSLVSNSCGTSSAPVSISPSSSCSVTLSFGGSEATSLAGNYVTLTGSDISSSIPLSGISGGFNSAAQWSSSAATFTALSAANTSFGTLTVGSDSASPSSVNYAPVIKTIYVRNSGTNGALNLGFSFTGDTSDFTVLSVNRYNSTGNTSCGATSPFVPTVSSCSTTDIASGADGSAIAIRVKFNPQSLGTKSLTITPSSNNGSSVPQAITLTGTGAFDAEGVWSSAFSSVTPISGNVALATKAGTSVSKTLYIRNIGQNGALNYSFTYSGDTSKFTVTNIKKYGIYQYSESTGPLSTGCGASTPFSGPTSNCLASDIQYGDYTPDGTITVDKLPYILITVSFNPTSVGTSSLTITPVSLNSSTAPSPITIDGTGQENSVATTFNGAVNFGTVFYSASNSNFVDKTVNITNTGVTPLTVNTVSGLPAGTVFQSTTCSNVAANGTCALVFRLNSDGLTSFTNAAITLNGPTTQSSITLTGSVVVQTAIATATAGTPVNFGTVVQNSSNPTAIVTITNTGTSPLTLSSVSGPPTPVSLSGNTCSNVAVNSTCSLTFTMSTASLTSFSNSSISTVGGTTNATFSMSGVVSASSSNSSNAVLFLDFESSPITDSKGSTLTLSGSPVVSSADAFFGSSSVSIPRGSFISATNSLLAMGTNDFSIELYAKPTSNIGTYSQQQLVDFRPNNTNGAYPVIFMDSSNKVVYFANSGARITSTSIISPNTWNKISIIRTAGVTKLFINDVQEGGSYSDTTNYAGTSIKIGAGSNPSGSNGFNGYLDNVMISRSYSQASITSGAPVNFGSATLNSTNPSATVSITNTGNSPLTISGVTGLPSSVSLTSNTCSNVVTNSGCSLTFTMSTSSITSFSGTTITINGGFVNATFTMTGAVTSPTNDTQYANVTVLQHFEGTSGSTSWSEPNTAKAFTFNNFTSTSLSSAQAKFGTTSLLVGGSATVTGSKFAVGTNDFTLETWVYPTVSTGSNIIVDARPANTNGAYLSMNIGANGSGKVGMYLSGTAYDSATSVINYNQWNHIAYSRTGAVGYLAVNGVIVRTITDNFNYGAGSIARINGNAFGVTGYSSMYLDEYRITSGSAGSGAARYTSSYTVPSAPFLDQ